MNLTGAQTAQFDEQGYLFFPDLLDSDEVAVLQQALPDILSRPGPEIIPEKDDPSSIRLAFGAHTYSEPFRCLTLLPRLLDPVRQLLRDDVYLHQSRLNPKQGFGGAPPGTGIRTTRPGIPSTACPNPTASWYPSSSTTVPRSPPPS